MRHGRAKICIISTGGTIEKTYDELDGTLSNRTSVLDMMLNKLLLHGVQIERLLLMNKDSLEMPPRDHELIADQAADRAKRNDGVVIVHGTDRLTFTGEALLERHPNPPAPIVLTGAMRPFEMHNTDAIQNFTEALLAVQVLSPGIYVSMHNRVLAFPGVVKDYARRTFCYEDELAEENKPLLD